MEIVLYAILGFITGFIIGRIFRIIVNDNKSGENRFGSSYKSTAYTEYNPYINHCRKGKK